MSILVLVLVASPGCGSDDKEPTGTTITCSDDELYDQVNDTCVPRRVDNSSMGDMGSLVPDMPVESDMGEDMGPGSNCDKDGDGALAEECGGYDCNDESRQMSPNNLEFCDTIDNDCSGGVNDGINCSFYAHSGNTLYAVDPFDKSIEIVGTDLPNLQDIDTHPGGILYGVTFDGLYRFDIDQERWSQVGEFNRNVEDPNGMAIDFDGTVFVTSQTEVYTVDIVDGRAQLLGDMDGDFYSSGDCVVNKYDTLYMTSKHDPMTDHLVSIDRETGIATEVGPIGFTKVYALTSAWGQLYGLNDQGQLIAIDTDTGAGEVIHQFQGIRFFGAASTPDR